jgi:hypothetical protein
MIFRFFCLLALIPTFLSFKLPINKRIQRGVPLYSEGIDVSGLKFVPLPEGFVFDVAPKVGPIEYFGNLGFIECIDCCCWISLFRL